MKLPPNLIPILLAIQLLHYPLRLSLRQGSEQRVTPPSPRRSNTIVENIAFSNLRRHGDRHVFNEIVLHAKYPLLKNFRAWGVWSRFWIKLSSGKPTNSSPLFLITEFYCIGCHAARVFRQAELCSSTVSNSSCDLSPQAALCAIILCISLEASAA